MDAIDDTPMRDASDHKVLPVAAAAALPAAGAAAVHYNK